MTGEFLTRGFLGRRTAGQTLSRLTLSMASFKSANCQKGRAQDTVKMMAATAATCITADPVDPRDIFSLVARHDDGDLLSLVDLGRLALTTSKAVRRTISGGGAAADARSAAADTLAVPLPSAVGCQFAPSTE